MVVQCPGCETKYNVPIEKMGNRSTRLRCSRCGEMFLLEASNLQSEIVDKATEENEREPLGKSLPKNTSGNTPPTGLAETSVAEQQPGNTKRGVAQTQQENEDLSHEQLVVRANETAREAAAAAEAAKNATDLSEASRLAKEAARAAAIARQAAKALAQSSGGESVVVLEASASIAPPLASESTDKIAPAPKASAPPITPAQPAKAGENPKKPLTDVPTPSTPVPKLTKSLNISGNPPAVEGAAVLKPRKTSGNGLKTFGIIMLLISLLSGGTLLYFCGLNRDGAEPTITGIDTQEVEFVIGRSKEGSQIVMVRGKVVNTTMGAKKNITANAQLLDPRGQVVREKRGPCGHTWTEGDLSRLSQSDIANYYKLLAERERTIPPNGEITCSIVLESVPPGFTQSTYRPRLVVIQADAVSYGNP